MTDVASRRAGLRKQRPGSNMDTWGRFLNEVLDAIDDTTGVLTLPMGVTSHVLDATQFESNESRYVVLRVIGSPGPGAEIIVPAVDQYRVIDNGMAVDLKVRTAVQAASAAVVVPAGAVALVTCDGTTVRSTAPTVFAGQRLRQVGAPVAADDAAPAGWVANMVSQAVFGVGQGVPQGTVRVTTAGATETARMDLTTGYAFQHVCSQPNTVLAFTGDLPVDTDMIVTLDLFGGALTSMTFPAGTEFPGAAAPALSTGWDCLTFRLTRGRVLCIPLTAWGTAA